MLPADQTQFTWVLLKELKNTLCFPLGQKAQGGFSLFSPPCSLTRASAALQVFLSLFSVRTGQAKSQRQNGQQATTSCNLPGNEIKWNGQAPPNATGTSTAATRRTLGSPWQSAPRNCSAKGAHTAPLLSPPPLCKYTDLTLQSNHGFLVLGLQQSCKTLKNLNLCDPLFIAVYWVCSCSISRERNIVLFCNC